MIQAENLSKAYGNNVLFDSANFQINHNEKTGLAGRNGSGKTTLFRILANIEEPSGGRIIIPKNYKIGYLKQELTFEKDSVIEEALLGLPENKRDEKWLAEKILFGLGFDSRLINLIPHQLSGGFKIRLNLAKILLSETNMMLLDEPTNYLDITSIRWLAKFLNDYKGELILITHDRSFMDQVITHIMIIHRKKIKKIKGKTSDLYLQIALEEENHEKERLNDEKKRKQIEIFINRFRAKATLSSLVQSRIKQLNKKEKKEKLEKMKILEFEFSCHELKAPVFLDIKNLTFFYDTGQNLINDISFIVNNKDRIAAIGPNGRGKSTLLKLLAGILDPKSGSITKNKELKIGYFGQDEAIDLHPENTIEEEIMLANPENNFQQVRDICGSLMFENDSALKKIKFLSGGEKSRVALGKILACRINLLILDEPTNNLDMESSDSLLSAIDNFKGAVIIVTHNEMFLNSVAERLIVFDEKKISVFESSYEDFLENVGWLSEKEQNYESQKTANIPFNKEIRKKRAEIIAEKSKELKPIEKKYKALEEKIIFLENNLEELNNNFIKASQEKNSKSIAKISKDIHDKKEELDAFYSELDIIMNLYTAKTKEFEIKLNETM